MCRKGELTESEARKHRQGICISSFCTTRPKKYKNGTIPLRCSACVRREWAEKNPEKYLYANLRGNARRRGKVFEISFEYFNKWLKEKNYLRHKRGRTKTSVSVDRDKNSLGYVEGNLAMLRIRDNSWKRVYVDYFREAEEKFYAGQNSTPAE